MSRLMAHLIAHYPDRPRSLAVARGLISGGADYLEVQFPFSDPTADGPVIQEACQHALDSGFSVDDGFSFVRAVQDDAIATRGEPIPLFLMTYASLIFSRGVKRFISDGMSAGCTGFILPDIPVDYDEGVFDAAQDAGATIMPVTVTSARERRVELLLQQAPEYIYVALRRGITGSRTEIGTENLKFIERLKPSGARIMAGFGISARDQLEALDPHVHAAVVGSAFVRTVTDHAGKDSNDVASAIEAQCRELLGR